MQPETRTALKRLALFLKEKQSTSVIKLLFTTDGQSQVLGGTTDFRERLDVSRSMIEVRPGRPLPGATSLSAVSLDYTDRKDNEREQESD